MQIIPAENMVAAFQDSSTALYATASTATDAQAYFEALERGTDGVVLHTDDPSQVFALKVPNIFAACDQHQNWMHEALETKLGFQNVPVSSEFVFFSLVMAILSSVCLLPFRLGFSHHCYNGRHT